MFKFFWKTIISANRQTNQSWRHDPLGQPDLSGLSMRQLADLPIPPEVLPALRDERQPKATTNTSSTLQGCGC
ncbi:hypothetical protein [Rhizobium sp. PDO1-076]|uniref:hypothetical protein n=1 Tax=Rhizobium sp. PDO1-076 TaxID=1125979 RepID=UPI000568CD50|nr:hypothetical protein [Rhizobium sp. PDO1-076]